MKKIKKSKLISTALGIISLMGAGTLLASCAAEEPSTPPASGQGTTPEQQVQQAVAYAIDQARNSDDTKLTLNSFDSLVQDIAKYLKAPESGQADTYATQRQQFDTAVKTIINEVVNQEVKQNFTKSVEDAAKTKLAEGLDAMKVAAQTNAINEAKKVRTKIVDKVFDKVVEGLINASLTALSTEAQSLNEDQKQVIVDSAKASVQNLKTSGLERIGKQIDKVIKTKLVSKNAIDQARSDDDTKLKEQYFRLMTRDVAKYLKAPESGQTDTYATQRQQFDTAVRAIIDEVSQQEKQNFNTNVEQAAEVKYNNGGEDHYNAMKVAAQTNAINEAKKVRTKIVDKVFDKVVEGLINASLTALSTEAQSLNEDQKQVIVDSAKASVQNLKTSGLERIGKQIDKVIKTKLVSKNAIDQARSDDDTKLKEEHFRVMTRDVAKYLKAPESGQTDTYATQRQQFDTAVRAIIDEVSQQEKQNFNTNVEQAAEVKYNNGGEDHYNAMKVAAQTNAINEAKKVRTKIVDKVFDKVVEGLINASLTALSTEAQSLNEDQKQVILNNYDNENNAERNRLRGKRLQTMGPEVYAKVQNLINSDSRSS